MLWTAKSGKLQSLAIFFDTLTFQQLKRIDAWVYHIKTCRQDKRLLGAVPVLKLNERKCFVPQSLSSGKNLYK